MRQRKLEYRVRRWVHKHRRRERRGTVRGSIHQQSRASAFFRAEYEQAKRLLYKMVYGGSV